MTTELTARTRRTDEDYTIDALAKGLKVVAALEGTRFEIVSVERIRQRTGFNYDFCMRALRTLKAEGIAEQIGKEWRFTLRHLAFCRRAAESETRR